MYLVPMEEVANDFVEHIRRIRDGNSEVPPTFQNELYKWGLECKCTKLQYIPAHVFLLLKTF